MATYTFTHSTTVITDYLFILGNNGLTGGPAAPAAPSLPRAPCRTNTNMVSFLFSVHVMGKTWFESGE